MHAFVDFCRRQSVHEAFMVRTVQKHATVPTARCVIHRLENVHVSVLDGQDNAVISVCIFSITMCHRDE